jgi:hypothetical protein
LKKIWKNKIIAATVVLSLAVSYAPGVIPVLSVAAEEAAVSGENAAVAEASETPPASSETPETPPANSETPETPLAAPPAEAEGRIYSNVEVKSGETRVIPKGTTEIWRGSNKVYGDGALVVDGNLVIEGSCYCNDGLIVRGTLELRHSGDERPYLSVTGGCLLLDGTIDLKDDSILNINIRSYVENGKYRISDTNIFINTRNPNAKFVLEDDCYMSVTALDCVFRDTESFRGLGWLQFVGGTTTSKGVPKLDVEDITGTAIFADYPDKFDYELEKRKIEELGSQMHPWYDTGRRDFYLVYVKAPNIDYENDIWGPPTANIVHFYDFTNDTATPINVGDFEQLTDKVKKSDFAYKRKSDNQTSIDELNQHIQSVLEHIPDMFLHYNATWTIEPNYTDAVNPDEQNHTGEYGSYKIKFLISDKDYVYHSSESMNDWFEVYSKHQFENFEVQADIIPKDLPTKQEFPGIVLTPLVNRVTTDTVELSPADGYEYAIWKDGWQWQDSNVFTELQPDTEYEFAQRVKETPECNASYNSIYIEVRTAAAEYVKPDWLGNVLAPLVERVTKDTVALKPVDGYEYAVHKKDGWHWQSDNVFTGLAPDTVYTFVQRVKETNEHRASVNSIFVEAKTERAEYVKPDWLGNVLAPLVEHVTKNTVELEPFYGYEYAIHGTDGWHWQDNNVFTGLAPDTVYTFIQRVKETNEHRASVNSIFVEAKTDRAEPEYVKPEYTGNVEKPECVGITTNSVTLKYVDGYEYAVHKTDGWHWQDNNNFTGLSADSLYTFAQRVKETDAHKSSRIETAEVRTQKSSNGGGGGSVSDGGNGKVDFGLNPATTTAATSATVSAVTIPAAAPTIAPGNPGTPSANVAQDGSVDGKKTAEDVDKIIAEINAKVKTGQLDADSAAAKTIHIPVKNAETLKAETIRFLAALSKNVEKNIVVDADTTDAKGKIFVRIYADISKLAGVKHDIALKGTVDKNATKPITDRFAKYYSNKIAVVSLAQKGSFGAKLEIAAKIDLTGLDKSKLIAYSYDSKTNKFKLIKDAKIKVDKNGFIHFTTETGGEILITDKPLAKIKK